MKQSPDFPFLQGHCKLTFGMSNSPMSSDHGADEMGDRDMNACVTSLSGPEILCTGTSTGQETRLVVEELTMKNMPDSAFLCSLSSSTSRLEQAHHFYPVLSELRSSHVLQDRAQKIFRLEQCHPMMPPHSDVGKPSLGTCGFSGPFEETSLSGQQQPVEDSSQRSVDGVRKGKLEFTHGGMGLRDWLKSGYSRGINKTEGLQLFRQIVELVDFAHSQDSILQELWPSRFILLPSNKVRYVGSSVGNTVRQALMNSDSRRKRTWVGGDINPYPITGSKHQKLGQEIKTSANLQYSMRTELQGHGSFNTLSIYGNEPIIVQLEEQWYASPEQCSLKSGCGVPSNIYCLGVLLFEVSVCAVELTRCKFSVILNSPFCHVLFPQVNGSIWTNPIVSFSCFADSNHRRLIRQQCQICDVEFCLQAFCRRIQRKPGSANGFFILNIRPAQLLGMIFFFKVNILVLLLLVDSCVLAASFTFQQGNPAV